jgi:hypothetical protein
MKAILIGHLNIAKILVDRGANLETRDNVSSQKMKKRSKKSKEVLAIPCNRTHHHRYHLLSNCEMHL